jgi:DsbC/DsbD-like thiol-disulfide interchange protein
MTRSAIVLTLVILLTAAACSKSPGDRVAAVQPAAENVVKRIASTDVVKAVVQPAEIAAGGSGEATVRLTIQSGYHVNANPPTFSYLIPTELTITPANGISVGTISYLPGINVKLAFSEKPLAVYEGDIEIKATLNADKSAKPGEYSLAAKLRIQACDDQVCYPPGTRDLTIPVRIK